MWVLVKYAGGGYSVTGPIDGPDDYDWPDTASISEFETEDDLGSAIDKL